MSSLLQEAIVDAKALRESALKNAETSVIEKYSEEVKSTLEQLLEQDEAAEQAPQTDIDKNIPLAATDGLSEEEGDIPNGMPEDGQEVPVNIDLDALQEAVAALENELNEDEEIELSEDEEIELTEEDLAAILSEDDEELNEEDVDERMSFAKGKSNPGYADAPDNSPLGQQRKKDEEEELKKRMNAYYAMSQGTKDAPQKIAEDDDDLSEELDADALVDAIMEKLTVDMGADLAGWAGRSSEDQVHQIEKELTHRRSTDVEEEMETLKKAQEELVFENKQLTEKLSQYEGVLGELQENLQDVNLSNARLLYTNRVLRNNSLNERQKTKIVEAISNAGSVTEARTIFETLQSTVEAKPKRTPQSLSEAIGNKRSSVIRATRQESTSSDPIAERMKRLAGIK